MTRLSWSVRPLAVVCGSFVVVLASAGCGPVAVDPAAPETSTTFEIPGNGLSGDTRTASGEAGEGQSEEGGTVFVIHSWINEVFQADAAAGVARDLVLQDCMAERGFEYVPQTDIEPMQFVYEYYLFDDVAAAREDGYPVYETKEEGSALGGGNPGEASLGPEEREAWWAALSGSTEVVEDNGDTYWTGGCLEYSENMVFGDGNARYRLADQILQLYNGSVYLTMTDDRVLDAMGKWSACMADRGYTVETREDVLGLRESQSDTKALAIAEAECASEYQVNAIVRAVLVEIEDRLLAEHQALLLQWREQLEIEQARIDSILE